MQNIKVRRSPLFFVGDKARILPQLLSHFPDQIDSYTEPFLGGGSAALNISAGEYFLSDISEPLIGIHKALRDIALTGDVIQSVCTRIEELGLTCSYLGKTVRKSLIDRFPKTYFAEANRSKYLKLREMYNSSAARNPLDLYILVIYGFNRMLRFGRNGNFNIPVGNVDFNSKTAKALQDFTEFHRSAKTVSFLCGDFARGRDAGDSRGCHFFYFDPPYLITQAEYNRFWSEEDDVRLMDYFDELTIKGFRCAVSNVLEYRGKTNERLSLWASQYRIVEIASNYINRFDNRKKSIREVLILNY
jgi:DNA adenine methylase